MQRFRFAVRTTISRATCGERVSSPNTLARAHWESADKNLGKMVTFTFQSSRHLNYSQRVILKYFVFIVKQRKRVKVERSFFFLIRAERDGDEKETKASICWWKCCVLKLLKIIFQPPGSAIEPEAESQIFFQRVTARDLFQAALGHAQTQTSKHAQTHKRCVTGGGHLSGRQ